MNHDQQKTLEELYEGKDEQVIDKPISNDELPTSPAQFGNVRHMVLFVLLVLALILVALFAGFYFFL